MRCGVWSRNKKPAFAGFFQLRGCEITWALLPWRHRLRPDGVAGGSSGCVACGLDGVTSGRSGVASGIAGSGSGITCSGGGIAGSGGSFIGRSSSLVSGGRGLFGRGGRFLLDNGCRLFFLAASGHGKGNQGSNEEGLVHFEILYDEVISANCVRRVWPCRASAVTPDLFGLRVLRRRNVGNVP